MQQPGFWDDQQQAASVSTEHRRATRRLESFRALESEVEDLAGLAELAAEDESMAPSWRSSSPTSSGAWASSRSSACSRGATTPATPPSPCTAARAARTRRTGPRCCCACTCAGRRSAASTWRWRRRPQGEEAGLKSATFLARGENAYGLFSAEKGVHRLVRLSPFDAAHRRHTSFALVEVSPLVEDDVDVEIDDSDLRIETYRASGAGGQHVNKTDSAVRITHIPTKTVVQCQNERSQSSNKQTAMKLLKSKLVELEERKRREEMAREKGEAQDVAWGSQIRSYVLHPYTMVKDHRTGFEMGDAQRVLDGDLDGFVHAYLVQSAGDG